MYALSPQTQAVHKCHMDDLYLHHLYWLGVHVGFYCTLDILA